MAVNLGGAFEDKLRRRLESTASARAAPSRGLSPMQLHDAFAAEDQWPDPIRLIHGPVDGVRSPANGRRINSWQV